MATIAEVEVRFNQKAFQHGVIQYKWATVTDSDTCQAVTDGGGADRSIQVVGSFASGTLDIQGSNDGENWVTLKDMAGDALQFSVAGINSIRDNTLYIRPGTPTGGGADLDITLLAKTVR